VSAVDRMSDGYEPRFDIDLEVGKQGELFIARIVDSIAAGSHEVKTDEKALVTGNVYLECQCLYRGRWERSGIAKTEAEMWCHVIGEAVVIAPVYRVRDIARHYWPTKWRREMLRGSHPTKGIVLPIPMFLRDITEGFPEVEQKRFPGGAA
jgi:hypothetical protein